jgi:hypothetical protein
MFFRSLGDKIYDPYTRREIGYGNHYNFREKAGGKSVRNQILAFL